MRRLTALALISSLAASGLVFVTLGGCPGTSTGTGVGGAFNVAPTPIIVADVRSGIAPLTVHFSSDRSTDDGLIVSRDWDFGDGTDHAQDISPAHIFSSTGVFTVRLTLTDDNGLSASRTVDITVTEAPVPIITTDPSPPVADSAPALISFDASKSFDPDGTVTKIKWDFGDGTVEFVTSILHQYALPGTYKVKLEVTDNAGVNATSQVLVQIGVPPPDITLRVPPDNSTRPVDRQITNIVVSQDSPVWVQALTRVDPAVAHFTSAGLDADSDVCQAQSVIIDLNTGTLVGCPIERDPSRVASNADAIAYFQDQITEAVYTPDGVTLLTASANGRVRRHRVIDNSLINEFVGVPSINSIAVSPNGLQFVYGQSNGLVVLRDISTGATVREFASHGGGVNKVVFSPDGTQIFSAGNDRRAILWKISDGTILRDFIHPLAVNGVAVNAADPTILASACEDGLARVFNLTGGNTVVSISGHGAPVNDVLFSRDGSVLYSAGDDNVTRSWNPSTGVEGQHFSDPSADVLSLAISRDGKTLVTGSADGFVRVWNVTTGQMARSTQACQSPVNSVQISPDARSILAAIGAKNALPLDVIANLQGNGNDLNLADPVPLGLRRVPAFGPPNAGSGGGRADVPPGIYSLWVQVSTDRPDPRRNCDTETVLTRKYYPNLTVQVTNPFTRDVNVMTPIATLVNDRASVVPPALAVQCTAPGNTCCASATSNCRQIVDLGSMNRDDRIFLSLLSTPGFGQTYESPTPFTVMLLDADQRITAWYEQRNIETTSFLGTSVVVDRFILFSPATRLVLGHNTARSFLVLDGAAGVDLRVQRGSGQFQTHPQRVRVIFSGSAAQPIAVRDVPATVIPPLNAADFGPLFNPPKPWDGLETQIIKNAIIATLQAKFTGLDVTFVPQNSANDPPPALPYVSLYIGGQQSVSTPGVDPLTGLPFSVTVPILGEADYVDPRNDTASGVGIVFATNVAQAGIQGRLDAFHPVNWANPVATEADLGALLGTVAAQQVGKLLGLRLVQGRGEPNGNAADIMGFTRDARGNDPTIALSFSITQPRVEEQARPGLPGIGLQDAPLLLTETVGVR